MNILTVNLLFSTLVFWVAVRIYILPKLGELEPRTVLLPILLLHSFRHLELMFLTPGVTYPGIPPQFAYPAAIGDLLAATLALAAMPAVERLGLEFCPEVSDETLKQLTGWKSLRWVDLHGTKVTAEGVAALRKDRPDVQVLWE